MAIGAHPRCVLEDFWDEQEVKGSFKWQNPERAEVKVEVSICPHCLSTIAPESCSLSDS